MSVDLVGSTAFKASHGSPKSDGDSPNPVWVDEIRHFYRDFPDKLNRAYERIAKPVGWTDGPLPPQVWKTIGDEIVFCCRLSCLSHLVLCVSAFVNALEQYGRYLDSQESVKLDVKGYGWIAAFPFPNVTVRVFDPTDSDTITALPPQEIPDEAIELAADSKPAQFDFLGREIDSGFRTGKFCSADKFSMSVELAWLISRYGDEAPMKGVEFAYSGRQELKGVLNDRPYPIVSIDVERSAARRKVRDRERELISGKALKAMQIHDFLESFIDDEGIPRLWLRLTAQDSSVPSLPADYLRFRATWESIALELVNRSLSERESADEDNQADDADELNDSIVAAGQAMIDHAQAED
ncbi:hypothetical protein LVY75_32285 [Sinorhizobium sp. B11]